MRTKRYKSKVFFQKQIGSFVYRINLCIKLLLVTFIEGAGWRRLGISFALGMIGAFALPPVSIIPLLIPAFSGFFLLIISSRNVSKAISVGWWFGFGHFLVSCYWVGAGMLTDPDKFAWLAVPAVIGLCGGLAFFPVLVSLTVYWLRLPGIFRVLLFSLVWMGGELLRGEILTGFPMNPVGSSWVVSGPMLQIVAIVGIYGLSFITVLCAIFPALLYDNWNKKFIYKKCLVLIVPVFILLFIWVGGTIRLTLEPEENVPKIKFMIVQANISQQLKWGHESRKASLEKYKKITLENLDMEVTHIIWPETAVPYDISNNPSLARWLSQVVPVNGLLFTGSLRSPSLADNQARLLYNSLHAINSDGDLVLTYDKHHLVPFGEYMPLRSIMSFSKLTYGDIDFSPGPGLKTLKVANLPPFSPLICYEVAFPGEVASKEVRPSWLLNITNDGWFGKTSGPYQHLQTARIRAIEEGLPIVRAANTGISAVFDPLGRQTAYLALEEEGTLFAFLPKSIEKTPYAVMGNGVLFLLSSGALLIVILFSFIKKKVVTMYSKRTIELSETSE